MADEIAGVAEVASGKLGGRPLSVVRGLADRVLPRDEHGPGGRALVRPADADMFGLGSREAVVAALSRRTQHAFGSPALDEDLVRALSECGLSASPDAGRIAVSAPADDLRLGVLAFAHGWRVEEADSGETTTVLVPLS